MAPLLAGPESFVYVSNRGRYIQYNVGQLWHILIEMIIEHLDLFDKLMTLFFRQLYHNLIEDREGLGKVCSKKPSEEYFSFYDVKCHSGDNEKSHLLITD
ncbi:hypothetical protein FKM82_006851 [Ascaphus truei]